MKRKIDAFLNGVSIYSAHEKIIGARIVEANAPYETEYESAAMLPGQRLIYKKRTGLNVSLFVKVRELYDMPARMDAINAINSWAAKGGTLKLSYRRSQTLNVKLIQPASVSDIREYTTEFELIFTADGWPYWQDSAESHSLHTASSGSAVMQIAGNAPTTVDVSLTAIDPITEITVTVDDASVKLSGLSISEGTLVRIFHLPSGIMTITADGTSIYSMLSADSGDCLMTNGGNANISFTLDGAAGVSFYAKGRWL